MTQRVSQPRRVEARYPSGVQGTSFPRMLDVAYNSDIIVFTDKPTTANGDTSYWQPGYGNFYADTVLFGVSSYSNSQFTSAIRIPNVVIEQGANLSAIFNSIRLHTEPISIGSFQGWGLYESRPPGGAPKYWQAVPSEWVGYSGTFGWYSVEPFTGYHATYVYQWIDIYCNDEDDAVAPTGYIDGDGKSRTTAYCRWFPGSEGYDTASVNLIPVLQEVISRPGFMSGNAVMIFFQDGWAPAYGGSLASMYPNSSSLRPYLSVEKETVSKLVSPGNLEIAYPF